MSGADTVFAILGSLGGIVAFITAIVLVIRSVARQVSSTEDNTAAIKEASEEIKALKVAVSDLKNTVNVQAERIAGQGREIADLRRVVFNGSGNKDYGKNDFGRPSSSQ